MLDKLKSALESTKSFVLYVVTPVLGALAYILYLLSQNRKLQDDLNSEKANEKLQEIKTEEGKVDSNAKDSLDNYNRIKSQYDR